jgi:hypothetical protein
VIIGVTGRPGEGKTLRLLWLVYQYCLAGSKVATNIELTEACPFQQRVARLDEPVDPEAEHVRACPHCQQHKGEFGYLLPHEWPVFKLIEHAHPGYYPCRWEKERPVQWYRAFWHFLGPDWVVAVSEATDYWDSMEFAAMPKICRAYFAQHRKLGHRLLLDFQNIDNLYNRVRRMMQLFILCEHNARHHWLWRHAPIEWSAFCADSFGAEQMNERTHVESGFISYREAMGMFKWYRTDQIYGSFGDMFVAEKSRKVVSDDGEPSSVGGGEAGRSASRVGDDSDAAATSVVGVEARSEPGSVVRHPVRLRKDRQRRSGLFGFLLGARRASAG